MSHNIMDSYYFAKQIVYDEGYGEEIAWQAGLNFDEINEKTFMRELAWVILSSGMKEQVTRAVFDRLSPVFFNWSSIKKITRNEHRCLEEGLKVFNNEKKLLAIIESAKLIDGYGFCRIKRSISHSPIDGLKIFPFIGPVTSYHLAKNIGIPVAKPDRHLVRIAEMVGYDDVQTLCGDISKESGDAVPVVDIVLWRFAKIEPNYLMVLKQVNGRLDY